MSGDPRGRMRLRLICLASGADSPEDGHYLVSCDVDAYGGRGFVNTTEDPAKAMAFDDFGQAMEYWQRQSTVRPIRADGKPNRPLTAWNVEAAWG